MTTQWVSASLLDQNILAALPGLDVDNGTVNRTISDSETVSLTLNLDDDTAENWETAIFPCAVVLACYDDTDPAKAIIWAGVPTTQDPAAESNRVPIGSVTFEGFFERAYVGDVTYDETWFGADIVADLLTTWFIPSTGVAVALDYTPGEGGQPIVPIVVNNTDMTTVKSVLDGVCAQLGLEYTVEWDWAASGTKLAPRLRFGVRIGTPQTGPSPNVILDMPGCLVSFTKTLDYSTGAGANRLIGYSTGQGAATPISATVTAPTLGRPVIEYRYAPEQSISPSALTQYVTHDIAILGPGAQPVTLAYQTDRSEGRRYGTDWQFGDDIGYRVAASYQDEKGTMVKVLAFPNGTQGTVRVIGIQYNPKTGVLTPVAADPAIYGSA